MAAPTLETTPTTEMLRRLLDIAQAQATAITSWDLDAFQGLLDERAALQRVVEQIGVGDHRPEILGALLQVAEIDRANIGRVTSMIEETSRSLDEVHQGQIALNGYGLPGSQPVDGGSLLDTMR
jgi:hypothetical protein